MRFAIASTDGKSVDEHFGRARRFWIYDLEAGGPRFVAARPVTPLSTGAPDHPFDEGRFVGIAEVLEDCRRVYCARIGERPAAELAARGIEVVVQPGPLPAAP
ncbi:NifB/NifX family molybdenum-iron cluster-binding protein [Deferrisoma camini]|uniref:NifB/NifX family molybdenum-iron cluster-binding protein n=1 Tax=Deferrisoma camini TaxID=1035120 RepID=UPI00046D3BBB|nr:NifB/NifX family molybdenum-iron cluster-binding protein [Deferrisoma camini]